MSFEPARHYSKVYIRPSMIPVGIMPWSVMPQKMDFSYLAPPRAGRMLAMMTPLADAFREADTEDAGRRPCRLLAALELPRGFWGCL